MKLVVTGSNGFVAGSIIAQANEHWELHGIARTAAQESNSRCIHHEIDLQNNSALSKLLLSIQPDAVIHCAAIANIDYCENNQAIAEDINVGITNHITQICKDLNAKLIFCSTDAVFDGITGNYMEQDATQAINFYAATKIKAEQIVLAASPINVVARLALVMGLPVVGKGNSFLFETIEKLQSGQSIKFPEEEIRTPIDVITLGKALLELSCSQFGGIIHLAGNTSISRYKMAKQIALATNLPEELITTSNGNPIAGRAPRAKNASLNNTLAKQVLQTPMLNLEEGLALTLHFKKNRKL